MNCRVYVCVGVRVCVCRVNSYLLGKILNLKAKTLCTLVIERRNNNINNNAVN